MHPKAVSWPRRTFLQTALAAGGALLWSDALLAADEESAHKRAFWVEDLPKGAAPAALEFPHFPSRFHAFVWRNWPLVTVDRLAQVAGTTPAEILRTGQAMGLAEPPPITVDQQRRSYITVIRRNWHLLPYEQLLQLLAWTPEQMAFTLREDDFLYAKLGSLKPQCPPVRFSPPSPAVLEHEREIAATVRESFVRQPAAADERLFQFIDRLSRAPEGEAAVPRSSRFNPRFFYSYFALYGDPLLEKELDPYPDGYLAQLAAVGVNGVWLQAVLHKLAPFPWEPAVSARYAERLDGLRALVERARRRGIGVYLYLNEPRAMPLTFYKRWPDLKGVVEGDYAALCTSHPDVQRWLMDSVSSICRAVPDLAGFFTITASENLSNCWSHNGGKNCRRCRERQPAQVIAEVNALVQQAIDRAGTPTRLLAWDWGWADDWVPHIIAQLPKSVALMSVSEWSMPIERGGVSTRVGEYSISTIGPGPRAKKHWALAKDASLRTMAKIQAGNTWELSAVPYIPALRNVAQHAANLLSANVDGLMLGWTLGGYPSPNLEVVAEVAAAGASQATAGSRGTAAATDPELIVSQALNAVARRRFGPELGPSVVAVWQEFSRAFSEFPFDGGVVYNAPMQFGPSNLLWSKPTGYHATMIGFPYDDLNGWRGPYPAEVFIGQFDKMATGFEKAVQELEAAVGRHLASLTPRQQQNARDELSVASAAWVHLRSTANQARFVHARDSLARGEGDAARWREEMKRSLDDEKALARKQFGLQSQDSRIGFEATNHYYYVPIDLMEKVLNCEQLLREMS